MRHEYQPFHVFPPCIYDVCSFIRNSQTRVRVDRWIFTDVGMMMMQTGMVKGNTAYSSYLDGMPVSGFLFHPFPCICISTCRSFCETFVRINERIRELNALN